MKRRIIKIDGDKCSGCGLCAAACHEGAIEMRDGKALLLREDYCDGLGNCLPLCPTGAIDFEEKETAGTGSPETNLQTGSSLSQWPVQIKLAPVNAPYFEGADLLISADCCAYAYGNFHNDFMKDRITLIGCPKLDGIDYSEKLTAILRTNKIRSVTVTRMEVPCCGGIERAAVNAFKSCGRIIPWQEIVITTCGERAEATII
ncbi:MAG: 4Fe-4S binding protein [Spirochaetaceae bacterium]|nr:4Fe-4S binding protein [Spirochaetaceae bacterium]